MPQRRGSCCRGTPELWHMQTSLRHMATSRSMLAVVVVCSLLLYVAVAAGLCSRLPERGDANPHGPAAAARRDAGVVAWAAMAAAVLVAGGTAGVAAMRASGSGGRGGMEEQRRSDLAAALLWRPA